jgi:hypothetical protein
MASRKAIIPVRPATSDTLDRHRARELRTLRAMFGIYCTDHHRHNPYACSRCGPVLDYATRRLVRCVFGEGKPTCANCTVHCYTEAMRERVKDVMRYAGPRMMSRHPLLALDHVLSGRRPAPSLRARTP